MTNIIAVGIGGGLGAICRYLISLIPLKADFPMLTFITNFLGAVLIGFIVTFASKNTAFSKNSTLLWKTGFCGGFTTFSTFSLEAMSLLRVGKRGMSALYMVSSVIVCVAGVFLGEYLYHLVFEK